jgi:hypothetical protein
LAFAAFAGAFLTTNDWLGFIGATIGAPFCFFASDFPLFHWLGLTALVANFLAAGLLYRGRREIAFAALVPFMIVATVLAVFALRGIRLLPG